MAVWIFTLLCIVAPPDKLAELPSFPGWAETAAERTARYRSIADDIAAVTTDPREMAALVSIGTHESQWAPDTGKGPCWRGPKNDSPRCDFGAAAGYWQIRANGPDDLRELFASPRKAAKRALAMVRKSAAACVPKYGAERALAAYSSGRCDRGIKESADMVRLARKLLREHPPPKAQ